MQKRVIIRITFEAPSLKEIAELEEKLEEVLEEYGPYEVEITALSARLPGTLPPS